MRPVTAAPNHRETDELASLLELVGERLHRALIAFLGRDRGEDAYAESLLYAATNPERVLAADDALALLFTIGRSKTRTRRRRPVLEPATKPADPMPTVEPTLEPALAELSPRQRTAVVLIGGWDWSYGEVAQLLGISRSSVQRHYERGMTHMRERMGVQQ